ncbi:hypothetical protein EVAR_68654_1 [Eumeta japonica]|uniref:CUB domain-containing protein n=1 Tax=Eumeta variegata TaxID=151549 RepID=A0A4C1SIK9_EUMVA|nr:hypothetical protein EVAR_68654_1 [Eumeta japonica]
MGNAALGKSSMCPCEHMQFSEPPYDSTISGKNFVAMAKYFALGLSSTLEIFDSNGQMVDSYNGEHFRPPIIISSGKSLLLQFRGNGVTSCGFRAEVTFCVTKHKEDRLMPYTDCGGLVSGPGGAITMMNMIENNTDVRLFDCIWIIKPGNNYMMMKTHISLRIEEFHGMASRSDLTIRQGTTSDALEIENVVWPNNGEEITSPDEPPSYEAPPDYEEVIKIGMDHEMREPRERHRKHHRRHRDCSRASSNVTVSSTVPIHNCSDRPSTSAAAAMSLAAESIAPPTVILNEVGANVCQELTNTS